jgi:beta-aspartyl-peptidase (threonine type)
LKKIARISTSSAFALLLVLATACASGGARNGAATDAVSPQLQQHLTQLMDESAVAWNRGDLDAFLATYKDDARTAFMAPQITYGLADIRARYERTYFKDGQPKAQLAFGDLRFRPLGANHVLMTGRWYLTDPDGKKAEGYYTLIWENTPDGWKMIHDHSS